MGPKQKKKKNVNKNITVEAKLISLPMYKMYLTHENIPQNFIQNT
jgi:hypothetical protein